ncbi:hypothetical protein CSPX01_01261 [Colletotrichum filicis]|nr:hypothetical protein CSPX01_01261 [Colletotrichum filicis]
MSFSHTGDVPPPPPRPLVEKARTPAPAPPPPTVPPTGSPGAFLVELLIFNGSPFKDHWAYFVRSRADDDIGVKIHATGDVRNGFKFEVKRSHDLTNTSDIPTKRVSLQWVDAQHFKADAMLNWGVEESDERPVCGFEASKKVTLKDCQTWLVEAADYLVEDRMFNPEVAVYLHAIKQ